VRCCTISVQGVVESREFGEERSIDPQGVTKDACTSVLGGMVVFVRRSPTALCRVARPNLKTINSRCNPAWAGGAGRLRFCLCR